MESSPKIHKCTSDEIDFIHVMEKLMDRLDSNQMPSCYCVRQIWLRRNSMVFSGDMVAPSNLVRRAREQVEAVDHAADKTNPTVAVSRSTTS